MGILCHSSLLPQYYDLAADVLAENGHLTYKCLSPYLFAFINAKILGQTSPEEVNAQLYTLKHLQRITSMLKPPGIGKGGIVLTSLQTVASWGRSWGKLAWGCAVLLNGQIIQHAMFSARPSVSWISWLPRTLTGCASSLNWSRSTDRAMMTRE